MWSWRQTKQTIFTNVMADAIHEYGGGNLQIGEWWWLGGKFLSDAPFSRRVKDSSCNHVFLEELLKTMLYQYFTLPTTILGLLSAWSFLR